MKKLGNLRNLSFSLCFAGALLLQCFLFHVLSMGTEFFPNITNFFAFCRFCLIKISICVFFAAFVPAFKSKWWTVGFSFIIGLWCEAELVYNRAFSNFIDAYSITMISNMRGFWDSVTTFVFLKDLLIFAPILLLVLLNCKLKTPSRNLRTAFLLLTSAVFCHIVASWCCYYITRRNALASGNFYPHLQYNPFSEAGSVGFWGFTPRDYIGRTSVIHGLIINTWHLISQPSFEKLFIAYSDDELSLIHSLMNDVCEDQLNAKPSTPLFIILVESFENWSITPHTTPVIYDFINSHNNILLCTKVCAQVGKGNSADGQMIVNTGLLPTMEGAACFRFSSNSFPSLSGQYESAAIISQDESYNQRKMNIAYGIDEFFLNEGSPDSLLMNSLCEIYDRFDFVMVITGASHAPFNVPPPEYCKVEFPPQMPRKMSRYLTCIHYTDAALKEFLARVDTDERLKNSTILITGDHTVFLREDRSEFQKYCLQNNDTYNVGDKYCPMIVYSLGIKNKTVIDRECYQMDIYPTILHLIGRDKSYKWKGFGINMLDSTSVRPCSLQTATSLSDKMIRSDFFRKDD